VKLGILLRRWWWLYHSAVFLQQALIVPATHILSTLKDINITKYCKTKQDHISVHHLNLPACTNINAKRRQALVLHNTVDSCLTSIKKDQAGWQLIKMLVNPELCSSPGETTNK
jgi:hypothetical protein